MMVYHRNVDRVTVCRDHSTNLLRISQRVRDLGGLGDTEPPVPTNLMSTDEAHEALDEFMAERSKILTEKQLETALVRADEERSARGRRPFATSTRESSQAVEFSAI